MSVDFVGGNVPLAFLYLDAVTVLHLFTYPPGDVFGGGIEREYFIEVAMVEAAVNLFFYM